MNIFENSLRNECQQSSRQCLNKKKYISLNLIHKVLSYQSLLRDRGTVRRTLGTRLHLSAIAFNHIVAFRDDDKIFSLFIISIM